MKSCNVETIMNKNHPPLCDDCTEPKIPQHDIGYGMFICTDCLLKHIEDELETLEQAVAFYLNI